jgi:hypothetical protein
LQITIVKSFATLARGDFAFQEFLQNSNPPLKEINKKLLSNVLTCNLKIVNTNTDLGVFKRKTQIGREKDREAERQRDRYRGGGGAGGRAGERQR